jgi:hypothetical protein
MWVAMDGLESGLQKSVRDVGEVAWYGVRVERSGTEQVLRSVDTVKGGQGEEVAFGWDVRAQRERCVPCVGYEAWE